MWNSKGRRASRLLFFSVSAFFLSLESISCSWDDSNSDRGRIRFSFLSKTGKWSCSWKVEENWFSMIKVALPISTSRDTFSDVKRKKKNLFLPVPYVWVAKSPLSLFYAYACINGTLLCWKGHLCFLKRKLSILLRIFPPNPVGLWEKVWLEGLVQYLLYYFSTPSCCMFVRMQIVHSSVWLSEVPRHFGGPLDKKHILYEIILHFVALVESKIPAFLTQGLAFHFQSAFFRMLFFVL